MIPDVGPPPYKAKNGTPKRHNEYYLEGGNLVIQVQETLFRVWKTSFRTHSKGFKALLGPQKVLVSRSIPDGADDEHPLYLEDIKASEFEYLLWIIYPPVFGKYKADTAKQWVAILDLATQWEFDDIRKLAIKQLAEYKLEAVEKIELQQKYHIEKQWAYQSYVNLCSRVSPLTSNEAKRLGIHTATLINQTREKLMASGRRVPVEVEKKVCSEFELTNPEAESCSIQ